jgi:hypothetical protein
VFVLESFVKRKSEGDWLGPYGFIAVRALAQEEGQQLQSLVDEALSDLIEKRKNARSRPHPHVVCAHHASHEKYDPLDKKLTE